MFLGWREEYCEMVVQLCSWIFELCSCIFVCSDSDSWKRKIEICPWKTAPTTPPPRIHRTLRQPPSWKSAWEIPPTTPPSNSPNVTTTPLLEIGLRNHSNYPPPLEFTERYDNPPPGNRPEKSLQLPPPSNSKSPNVTTTPLLEIGLRNHSNYPPPPSNSPNVTTTPLLEIGLRNHSNYPPSNLHRTWNLCSWKKSLE